MNPLVTEREARAKFSDYVRRGCTVTEYPVQHLIHGRVLLCSAEQDGVTFERWSYAKATA